MRGRELMEPTMEVVAEGKMSRPIGVSPYDGRDRTRALPRWPEEPVTSTLGEAIVDEARLMVVVHREFQIHRCRSGSESEHLSIITSPQAHHRKADRK